MTRTLPVAVLTVAGLTLTAAAAAALDPALGPSAAPHPTLIPGVTVALSIWQSNLRLLSAPFLLAAVCVADSRTGRVTGDLIIAALTGYSTVTVGLALGRWGTTLIPYLPNLPAEWAALSLAVATWLRQRHQQIPWRALAGVAAAIAALLAVAAILETWATPHRTVGERRVALTVMSKRRRPRDDVEGQWRIAQCASAQRWCLALTPSHPDPFKGGITA